MKSTRKMKAAVSILMDFIEVHDIDPENVDGLLTYMKHHRLEWTTANLTLAHKALSEKWFAEHPEDRPTPAKWTQHEIETMAADEFKKKVLTDPEFAAVINGTQAAPRVEPKKTAKDVAFEEVLKKQRAAYLAEKLK